LLSLATVHSVRSKSSPTCKAVSYLRNPWIKGM